MMGRKRRREKERKLQEEKEEKGTKVTRRKGERYMSTQVII